MQALAAAELRSGRDLRRLEPGFPDGRDDTPGAREELADYFTGAEGFVLPRWMSAG